MQRTTSIARLALVAATAGFLGGCAPLMTQSPGQGLSPVNAVSEGEDKHLMLFGHDVVSYFTETTHRPGNPATQQIAPATSSAFSIFARCSAVTGTGRTLRIGVSISPG